MIFDVYKVSMNTSTSSRAHLALFIESGSHERGYLVQVLGDVQAGYTYDVYGGHEESGVKVECISGFVEKELIGYVEESRLMDFMDACESVELPGVQMDLLGRKIDKTCGWYRDGEWFEDVIKKLKETGLLTLL